tara:strand:- start:1359 stop:1544 length:186 start_codon:yes stop_codon:yes gene_type:complete
MSGDYFTHNDRQPAISHFATLKWTEDGELSTPDMKRVLELLENVKPIEVNARYRNGSPMQE